MSRQEIDINQTKLIIADIGATTKDIATLNTDYPNALPGQEVHSNTEVYKKVEGTWVILKKGAFGADSLGQGLLYSSSTDRIFLGLGHTSTPDEITLSGFDQNLVIGVVSYNLYWGSLLTFAFEVNSSDLNSPFQVTYFKDTGAGETQLGLTTRVSQVANQWDRITQTFYVDKDGEPFSTGGQVTFQMKAKRLSGTGEVKIRNRQVIRIAN